MLLSPVLKILVCESAPQPYLPETDTLADMFITLAEGRLPEAEQEIVVDTFVLEELGLPCELGQKVPLRFRFMGEMIAVVSRNYLPYR